MENKTRVYCEDCGESSSDEKPISGYCPKHLAEHTPPPHHTSLEGWEKEFDETFELHFEGCGECGGSSLLDKREVPFPRGEYHCEFDLEKIKTFIKNLLTQREAEWREVCVCAAVKAVDGSVYRGHRHGDCLRSITEAGKEISAGSDSQGFITTRNRFVTREEGRKLQDAAGIPSADKEGYRGNTLFSEDLYQGDRDVLLSSLTSQG